MKSAKKNCHVFSPQGIQMFPEIFLKEILKECQLSLYTVKYNCLFLLYFSTQTLNGSSPKLPSDSLNNQKSRTP